MTDEICRRDFLFGIEYERHGDTRPDVAKCLAFIDKVAAGLAG